jgi:hypothetical protein
MPTGVVWGKGHGDELVAFEANLNDGDGEEAEARLRDAARQMRLPGVDLMDIFWRVFYGREPDALSDVITGNWFGRHPDPDRDGQPMWASNSQLTPQQTHALLKETFARAVEWRAGDTARNRIEVWARCGEPELQAWLLWPEAPPPTGTVIAHVFVATPYNSAYPPDFSGPDPEGRPEPAPEDREAADQLLDALVQLTALQPGGSISAHLGAADRVAQARAAVPGADATDDNLLFGALCRGLAHPADQSDPPFKGTGLAVRMGAEEAEVSGVIATTGTYSEPPGGDLYRSAPLDSLWSDVTHQGIHLRYSPS